MVLENIGTNFWAYVPLLMVLIICFVGYKLAKTLYKLSKIYDKDEEAAKQLTKNYIRQSVVIAICLVFGIFAGFFAYGPGSRRVQSRHTEKSGWMERTEKLPDEKPINVITQEGEEHKDKTGTLPKVATEEEYNKSKEEADKAIEEMLKRNQNQ